MKKLTCRRDFSFSLIVQLPGVNKALEPESLALPAALLLAHSTQQRQ